MEIFSANVRETWNRWELRVLVLLSLSWQVLLIMFGSQRKYRRSGFISSLVWLTYLSADWLATVSLGTLASSSQGDQLHAQTEDKDNVVKALWAPFLLLHLGGPDSITSYSLEDNNLWLRHLLQLVVQVAVAFHVFLRSWTNEALTFITIPVFISGIIKYSERIWVLRSASTQQIEDSLLTTSARTLQQASSIMDLEIECIHKAYSLFSLLKRLYANLSLRFAEGQQSYSLIVDNATSVSSSSSSSNAFKLVELQLGFLYDMLYTKATIIYSLMGLISRLVSFFCILFALIAFHFLTCNQAFSTDTYVTYGLFTGAICLEIYAASSLIFSDQTTRVLTRNRTPLHNLMFSAITNCRSILPRKKRWSESIAQHNLVSFCLKPRVRSCIGRDFLFRIYFTMESYWQRTWEDVDADIKRFIFEQLLEKHKAYRESRFDYNELKFLLGRKGDFVLKKRNCLHIDWSVDFAFDYSLLIWHVATDICFHSDPEWQQDLKCKASKKISDYMLYVLLMRPFMLPKWIDRISFVRDTYREATTFLHRRQFPVTGVADACKMMLQLHLQCRSLEPLRREKTSKSVLLDACRLAEQLLHASDRWEMICEVWIEKLTYAASHCEWEAHAQQLRRGGELLTHVSLLMADLGLSEQFDIGRHGSKLEGQYVGWGWGRSISSP